MNIFIVVHYETADTAEIWRKRTPVPDSLTSPVKRRRDHANEKSFPMWLPMRVVNRLVVVRPVYSCLLDLFMDNHGLSQCVFHSATGQRPADHTERTKRVEDFEMLLFVVVDKPKLRHVSPTVENT
jgi:hypothetical protein